MAKVTKKVVKKTKKTKEKSLFYANANKLKRAKLLVANKDHKKVKEAYLSLGGLLVEGRGIEEVK